MHSVNLLKTKDEEIERLKALVVERDREILRIKAKEILQVPMGTISSSNNAGRKGIVRAQLFGNVTSLGARQLIAAATSNKEKKKEDALKLKQEKAESRKQRQEEHPRRFKNEKD